jgi:hypothetical protein
MKFTQKRQEICAAWDMFEENEPDISTERLMAQTADFCKCDVSDVADALYAQQEHQKHNPPPK